MKFFKTKHEKDSAAITTIIAILIILLLFVVSKSYMDPPEEYGVAVNFGTSNEGSGNVQPLQPIKSEPLEINKPYEPTPPEEVKPEPAKPNVVKEEVLTADNDEEIAIKKQKEAALKAKTLADAKAKAEAEEKVKKEREALEKKRAEDEKKRSIDALVGGVSKSEGTQTGGEGNDNKAGDKGQLDGNPYAPSYFGSGQGTGGAGYGLNGRGKASYQSIKQNCNEAGLVIVRIVVNQEGHVVEAVPGVKGTTNTAPCLLEPAKKIALSHKWQADANAPTQQIGFVKVNFNLGQ